MKFWPTNVPRAALLGLAIIGFTGSDGLGQAPSNRAASTAMPAQAALAEFGLPGTWAQDCARPYVVLTFESGAAPQLALRQEKDGVRFDIRSATKIDSQLISFELRRSAVLSDGKWQAAAADQPPDFIVGKRGNDLVSLWEMQLRHGVPAGVYAKCGTLGPFVTPQPRNFPPPPRP
jgi:hypothetical protein